MTIELRRLAPAAAQAWATLFDLAEESPDSWILVGGQMILLLALEHGEDSVRPSQDMDIVVNVRVRPDGTRWLSAWLEARGFDLEGINRDQIGHRFVKAAVGGQGNVVIDVLAPAGVGERARLTTIPPARTVQAPGALQAFARSRPVDILISDSRDGNERRGESIRAVGSRIACRRRRAPASEAGEQGVGQRQDLTLPGELQQRQEKEEG